MSKNNTIFFLVDTYKDGKFNYNGFYIESNISKENFRQIVSNLYDVTNFEEDILRAQFDAYSDGEYSIVKLDNELWENEYQNKFATKAYEISFGKSYDNEYKAKTISIDGKSKSLTYIKNNETNDSKLKICFRSKRAENCYNKATKIGCHSEAAIDKVDNAFKYMVNNFNEISPKEIQDLFAAKNEIDFEIAI